MRWRHQKLEKLENEDVQAACYTLQLGLSRPTPVVKNENSDTSALHLLLLLLSRTQLSTALAESLHSPAPPCSHDSDR